MTTKPGDYDVFLSYRRADGATLAQLLYERLRRRGYRPFLDVRCMPSGRYDQSLLQVIEETPDFVPILTAGCLQRSIALDDWFRREVEHAIATRRNIAPLLAEGIQIPSADPLAPPVSELALRQATPYNHEHADSSIEKLCQLLTAGPRRRTRGLRLLLGLGRRRVLVTVAMSFFVLAAILFTVERSGWIQKPAHEWIGAELESQGDLTGALREYRAGLQISERLASSDPGNAVLQRDVSISHGRIGAVLHAQGDLAGALRQYVAGLQISERLASSDPSNAVLQRDVSISHGRIGAVLHAQGDLAGALREYVAGLQISERLASSDPSNAVLQRDVSFSHGRIGAVLHAQGDLAGAQREYEASLRVRDRLASRVKSLLSDPEEPMGSVR